MTRHRYAGSRRLMLALVLLTGLLVVPPHAHAATTDVTCLQDLNDIEAVQTAVNGAAPGTTIVIHGICDFTLAAPHGGDKVSIQSAAVVIRPGAPIDGLTIIGAGAFATIIGGPLSTAFYIAPGNNNVTIKRLKLVDFARPIVAEDTTNTVIGDATAGSTPSDDGVRIIGGALLDSSILAIANDRGFSDAPGTVTVQYGTLLATHTATFSTLGRTLSNFKAIGNYITYGPVGLPTSSADVVAIDVRQKNSGSADGITIKHNAIGFLTVVFLDFNINSIRVEAMSDDVLYHISNVTISNNNLGRLEELPNPLKGLWGGGREGIAVMRATNVTVAGNRIRGYETFLLPSQPGGGLVLSDVTNGTVKNNNVFTLADPLQLGSDLGAIGIVDDLQSIIGTAGPGGPPSTNVTVTGNTIGKIDGLPLIGSERGVVVNGSSLIFVNNNDIVHSTDSALNIGVGVAGPSGSLPRTVTSSDLCDNILDGILDDPNEVTFEGGAASVGNSFPGGSLFPGNGDCVPRAIVLIPTSGQIECTEGSPTPVTYQVRLSRVPSANVTVNLTFDTTQLVVAPTTLTFTPLTWQIPQTVSVLCPSDGIPQGEHIVPILHTAVSADANFNGLTATMNVLIHDIDKGVIDVFPTILHVAEGGPSAVFNVVLLQQPCADVTVTVDLASQVTVTPTSRTFTSVNWNIPQQFTVTAVDDSVREGTHQGFVHMVATSACSSFNGVPVPQVLVIIDDNDNPLPPVFTSPGPIVCTSNVIFSGSAEMGATVTLRENNAVIGTGIATPWTIGPIAEADGPHVVAATQTATDGRTSQPASRVFTVHTVAPPPPVITSPVDGDTIFGNKVTVSGTGEPGDTVILHVNGSPVSSAFVLGDGSWSITITLQAGQFALTATQSNGCQESPPSNTVNITVVVPDAPIILQPPEGSCQPADVLVSGTAADGTTVSVNEGGTVLASNIPVTSGEWSVKITFKGGNHTIVAFAHIGDAVSQPSAPRSFCVDAEPPHLAIQFPEPTLLGIHIFLPFVEEFAIQGTAWDNVSVSYVVVDYKPILLGAALTDNNVACSPCGGASGPGVVATWKSNPTLMPGLYTATATAFDEVGNKSNSESLTFLFVA